MKYIIVEDTGLEQLDARFAEIGFPNPDDLTIPAAMRLEIAKQVGQFYNGEVLVVDRRGSRLTIRTVAVPLGFTLDNS